MRSPQPTEADELSSPFVEDLSSAVQHELHQRRENIGNKSEDFFVDSALTEADLNTEDSVNTMSLQDLLDDIRNM